MFELFTNRPYTFLELENSINGRTIKNEYPAMGIIKLTSELGGDSMKETELYPVSLHIKPSETFIDGRNLVGHGIRIEGEDYRIQKQVDGYDFDLGKLEFYKLSLQKEAVLQWPSELPLL